MFARMGLRSLILVLLALAALLAAPIESQTEISQYVVRGSQSVNARSCARLSCAVIAVFEPGTELECSGTVQGDVVGGSDEWVQVIYAGDMVYVHSTLVEPQEAADAPPGNDAESLAELSDSNLAVSTANWREVNLNGYSVQVPSAWRTPEALLDDPDYWRLYIELNGKGAEAGQRAVLEETTERVQNGEFDLALIDPFGTGTLVTVAMENTFPSLNYLQQGYNAYATDTLGADIIESELGSLPAGEVLHEIMAVGTGDMRVVTDVYFIQVDNVIITVELDMVYFDAPRYMPFAEAVAESVVVDEDAKRW